MINWAAHRRPATGTVQLRKFDGAVVGIPEPGWLRGRQVGRAGVIGRIIYRIIRIERSRGGAGGKIVVDVGFIVGHEVRPTEIPGAPGLVSFIVAFWSA